MDLLSVTKGHCTNTRRNGVLEVRGGSETEMKEACVLNTNVELGAGQQQRVEELEWQCCCCCS